MSYTGNLYIFFDTNALESKFNGSHMYLAELHMSTLYYEIVRNIKNYHIERNIILCIPDIVWLEFRKHLCDYYKSSKDSLSSLLDVHQKAWGHLFDIDINYKIDSLEDYKRHLTEICNAFIESEGCKIVSYDDRADLYNKLSYKAIHHIPPFRKIQANGKTNSDAGFKDAVIVETIVSNVPDNEKGLFITYDRDYTNVNWPSNIVCKHTKEDVFSYVEELFSINNLRKVTTKLNDAYNIDTIIAEEGINKDTISSVNFIEVKEVNHPIYSAIINIAELDVNHIISIKYDFNSNSILEQSSQMEDSYMEES